MKRLPLLLCVCLPLLLRADPVADLAQALDRLHHHASYSWETTITPASVSIVLSTITYANDLDPTGRRTVAQWTPQPIVGRTDTAQGTLLTANMSRRDGSEIPFRVLGKGDQHAYELAKEWLTSDEFDHRMVSEKKYPAPARITVSGPTGSPNNVGGSSTFYTARLLRALRPPAAELDQLLTGAEPVMRQGKTLVVTLSPETAADFVYSLRHRDSYATSEARPSFAEGSLTINLKEGEIVSYDVKIDADIGSHQNSAYKGREHSITLKKNTKLSKFDRTKLDVPAAAEQKLAASVD